MLGNNIPPTIEECSHCFNLKSGEAQQKSIPNFQKAIQASNIVDVNFWD